MSRRWLAAMLCVIAASCVAPGRGAVGIQSPPAGYDRALQKLTAAGRQKTLREAREQVAGAAKELEAIVERRPDFAPALAWHNLQRLEPTARA